MEVETTDSPVPTESPLSASTDSSPTEKTPLLKPLKAKKPISEKREKHLVNARAARDKNKQKRDHELLAKNMDHIAEAVVKRQIQSKQQSKEEKKHQLEELIDSRFNVYHSKIMDELSKPMEKFFEQFIADNLEDAEDSQQDSPNTTAETKSLSPIQEEIRSTDPIITPQPRTRRPFGDRSRQTSSLARSEFIDFSRFF